MFNVLCTSVLLPSGGLLEKLVCSMVPDDKQPEQIAELDERLLTTPPVALERCRVMTADMTESAKQTFRKAASALDTYSGDLCQQVREGENETDHYEDLLGSYLVKLSALQISEADSTEAAMLLKAIGDFERIGDHALNIVEAAQELNEKGLKFTEPARKELDVLLGAVDEIITLSFDAFLQADLHKAYCVEPLEQVIDDLKEKLRLQHILRLQQGMCSIESGFVWSDLLTALERIGDHCSNIAGCVVDQYHHNRNTHEALRAAQVENKKFGEQYRTFAEKYSLN